MKKKSFKRALRWSSALMLLCGIMFIASCSKDSSNPDPATVSFASASASYSESAGSKTVTLSLSKAAYKDGTVTITSALTSGSGAVSTWLTVPATVQITKGSSTAQFTITPVNNATEDGDHVITLTISNPSDGFELGSSASEAITVLDDEVLTAAFATATGSIAENATKAISVGIKLSKAATAAGSIVVSTAAKSTSLTTVPAITSGTITIPVEAGKDSVGFTVISAYSNATVDSTFAFTLSSFTGGSISTTSKTYSLTVGAVAATKTIAELRTLFSDYNDGTHATTATAKAITDNIITTGVVVSVSGSTEATSASNLLLTDADGKAGILIYFYSGSSLSHSFVRGDLVSITLAGASYGSYGGVLELIVPALANATKTGTATLPEYQTITVKQLMAGAHDTYQGELVEIANATFSGANGAATLSSNSGKNTFNDGGANTTLPVLYVRTAATTLGAVTLPLGTGTLKGLVSEYNGTIELVPQTTDEIFTSTASSLIGVTTIKNGFSFGDVAKGATSSAKTFKVKETGVAADITVTAPSYYQVSTDGTTYGATATVSSASATADSVTVYVQFAPTSGVNNTYSGNITLAASGATSKTIAVTGNETGNGASTLLLSETFDYGSTPGALLSTTGTLWSNVSAPATNAIQYVTSPLSMTNYPASGTGGAATLTTSGEDDKIIFSSTGVTSGTVYASALVNISAAQTGDYFLLISDGGSTNFYARVYAKTNDASTFYFGFARQSTASYTTNTYSYGQTYLLVIKYDFTAGAASLYISDAVASTEPASPTLGAFTDGNAPTKLGGIGLRQGSGSASATVTVDGIRVAQDWTSLFQN